MISFPNAKINIGLNVVERRNDGFHNIETLFYPVYQLYDVLEIIETEEVSLSVFGTDISENIEDNLIIRAYRLLQADYSLPALAFYLKKAIPIGAGLGGGSADAAFTLKMLNDMFCLKIPNKKLENYAVKLGADCPFFIENKPSMAQSKGEVLTEIDINLKGKFLLLVKPDIYINTAEAYANIIPHKPEYNLQTIINKPISEWKNFIFNDFEDVIFNKYPLLHEIKKIMYGFGAVYASMSGSGSTIYGIFNQYPKNIANFENYYVKIVDL